VTFPAEIVHPDEVESKVMATLSPDVAVALAAYAPRVLPAPGAELALIELLNVPTAPAGGAKVRTPARNSPDVAVRTMILRNDVAERKDDVMALPTFFWEPDEISGEKEAGSWRPTRQPNTRKPPFLTTFAHNQEIHNPFHWDDVDDLKYLG
jgi:hypothetical protein